MKVEELILRLDEITKISDQEWKNSLNERKVKELEFFDRDRDKELISSLNKDSYEKYYSNKKFYSTVKKSKNYCKEWIAVNAKGKIFLDYACGDGDNAIEAAKTGALLSIGLDISEVSINNARKEAERLGLKNTYFLQADAENTMLPDSSIDTIICSGMLHHLDLSYAFPELRRILAQDGKILAFEALNYNPFIKLYRKITPDLRTEWEKVHILSLKDLKFAKRFFTIGKINYWHFTSYAGAYFPKLLPIFEALDSILTSIPGIRLMSWIFTFELISKKNNKTI